MRHSLRWLAVSFVLSTPYALLAQGPQERVDLKVIDQIKSEGLERSKVMETISYLTDVYGPRLTGAPQSKVAGEWTVKRLEEWGLSNAHLETWGPFGRGWTLDGCTVNLTAPNYSSLIAYPKAWSPSTVKTIKGEPIYLDANTPEELEKFRGKLGKAIVLISPPREVKAQFEALGTRQTVEQLLNLANADSGAQRRQIPPGSRPGEANGQAPGGNPPGSPNSGSPNSGAPGAPAPGGDPSRRGNDARSSFQIQNDKWQLCYDEGAAVVIEPGRGDGGTVFVASANMPRVAEGRSAEAGNPFSEVHDHGPWMLQKFFRSWSWL